MKTLIYACTHDIRRTERYIYTTEERSYQTTVYRVYFDKYRHLCTVYRSVEAALQDIRINHWTAYVVPMEYVDHETLHHRYTRKGR